MKHNNLTLIIIILLAGVIIRVFFLIAPFLDSDQAITGLMARHILKGEFSIFFYGQPYCGSIEAYLAAIVFYLVGSTRFALNFVPFLESLLFFFLMYKLAKNFYNQQVATLSLLFIAIPPVYLTLHNVLARANYIENLIFGSIIFILTHKIVYGEINPSTEVKLLIMAGFVAGLGWWTNFQIFPFILTAAFFIFLKDKKIIFSKKIFFVAAAFFAGSLPFWVYNIIYPLASLEVTEGGRKFGIIFTIYWIFAKKLPIILGLYQLKSMSPVIPLIWLLIAAFYIICIAYIFYHRRKGLFNLCRLSLKNTDGTDILLFYTVFFFLIIIFSRYGTINVERYLLPLFIVIPVLASYFLMKIYRYRVVFWIILFLILSYNLYGNIQTAEIFDKNKLNHYKKMRQDESTLIDTLKKESINAAYALDYWIGPKLTFDSSEEIIFAHPLRDRYPQNTQFVNSALKTAYVFTKGVELRPFKDTLSVIGGKYRENIIGNYVIYDNFQPPMHNLIEISPDGWKVSSNYNNHDANKAFDRDIVTRWTSLSPQTEDMHFLIDLGRIHSRISRVVIQSGTYKDSPRSYIIEVSPDGKNWEKVIEQPSFFFPLSWSGPRPAISLKEGKIEINFNPRAARYLRITQQGKDDLYYWSIHEIFLYEAEEDYREMNYNLDEVKDFLKNEKIMNVYAGHWVLSNLPSELRKNFNSPLKKIKTGLEYLNPQSIIDPLSSIAFIAEKGRESSLEASLDKYFGSVINRKAFPGYMVYYRDTDRKDIKSISEKEWQGLSNYSQEDARFAFDGNEKTRWTTNTPQKEGIFFQVNLDRQRKISRVIITSGESINDYPRQFILEVSKDGNQWEKIKPINRELSTLYWTEEGILRCETGDRDIIFSPVEAKSLKITLSGKDDKYYWSIHEIRIYGE